MGKRIIQQRRGRATSTYRVKKKAFSYKLQFPPKLEGKGKIVRLFSSAAHTSPIAKISTKEGSFYIPAHKNMVEKSEIDFDSKEIRAGNILKLKEIPIKTKVYCIESRPGDGGKFIKSGGNYAVINRILGDSIMILFPSKKEKKLNPDCRAIIGVSAGAGRLDKPLLKAGKKHYIQKSQGKLWPKTSPIKMNAIDHPFGSGRGKNPKSKIAKRNAPPGRKVGLIKPRRTGKKK